MAYTGSLLLRTLPAIEHELGLDTEEIIRVEPGDMPRPNRDWPGQERGHNQHSGPTVIWDVTDDTDDLPLPDRSESANSQENGR
jgi:hypothetical protein